MTEDRLRAVEQGQGRMETLLTEHVREQREMNARLLKMWESHEYWIVGNGQPGARLDIDRLKRAQRLMLWPVIIAVGAALTSAGKSLWAWITGGPL